MEKSVDDVQHIRDRLTRIEGQVRGISKMVDGHRPCHEVLMQVMAARAALEKVAAAIVSSSLDECLALPAQEARDIITRNISLLTRV